MSYEREQTDSQREKHEDSAHLEDKGFKDYDAPRWLDKVTLSWKSAQVS